MPRRDARVFAYDSFRAPLRLTPQLRPLYRRPELFQLLPGVRLDPKFAPSGIP